MDDGNISFTENMVTINVLVPAGFNQQAEFSTNLIFNKNGKS